MRIVDTPIPVPPPAIEPPDGRRLDAALLPALVEAAGTEAARDRLAAGALAVTTGQQPGLFTGPLYTVHKALSAAALARALEAAWGRPVVPVFWLAGDDHDYAEAQTTRWIAADGTLVTGGLADRPPEAPMLPLSRLAMGDDVRDAVALFRAGYPASPFRDATLAWLERWYRPGRTVGEAFAGAMAELLAPFGVVCFDPTHPAARRAAAPLVERALDADQALESALAARAAQLADEGRPAPVDVTPGATLVFLDGEGGRDRLLRDGEAFVARRGGTRHTRAELGAIARDAPEQLSPNVLLRPVVEAALLPTVAYVAGPGELAYLPLAAPVYRALEVRPQAPVARWSGILVEPRVDRVLEKFGASLDELTAPGQALERRVVKDQLPREFGSALGELRTVLDRTFGTVARIAVEVDPTLERPAAAARDRATDAVDRIERKVERHLRKRQETELGQITRARDAVLPDGRPQERVLTVAGLLARYGHAVLDDLAAHVLRHYRGALVAGTATP